MSEDYFSNLYKTKEYIEYNPSYHEEDSSHKWNNFEKCINNSLEISQLKLNTIKEICEIGCGTGGILANLKNSFIFSKSVSIEGWDISPDAIKIAKQKYPKINFFNKDLLKEDKEYDLIICADVFEHIENVHYFLRELKKKSKYFLFNIPLESNLSTMLRGKNLLHRSFKLNGHVHFFSASSAKFFLELAGYEIINEKFAKNRTKLFLRNLNLKNFLITFPQYIIESINPYISSVLFGDSLVIFAKGNKND